MINLEPAVNWNQLPPEVLCQTLVFLNYEELAQCSVVNWTWYHCCAGAAQDHNKARIQQMFAKILTCPTFGEAPGFVQGLTEFQCTLFGDPNTPGFVTAVMPFSREYNVQLIEKVAEGLFSLCLQLHTKEGKTDENQAVKTSRILANCWCETEDYSSRKHCSPTAVIIFLSILQDVNHASRENDLSQKSFTLKHCCHLLTGHWQHFARALEVARSIPNDGWRDAALKEIILYADPHEKEDLAFAEEAFGELSTDREIVYCTEVLQQKKAAANQK